MDYDVLDVGCGMNKKGDIGIDYSKRSHADVIADSHFLPFSDGVFGKVVSTVVIEHSPNPLNFLKEQHRVLRKYGKVEVTTDNAQYARWTVMKWKGTRHEDYHEDHYTIFFPKNIERLVRLAGFKVESNIFLHERERLVVLLKVLVKIGFLREDCLYRRFKVCGVKP